MRFSTALVSAAALAALAACQSTAPAPEAAATAEPAAAADAAAPVPMPAGLTAEERFIWSTLTPEAQRQAAEFIANGGTLTQFINA